MTYIGKWDRVVHMNAGRDRAAERRNKGLDTGASRWKVAKPATPEVGSLERFEAESRARWEFAVSDIIEALRFDLYGHEWMEIEL